MTRKARRSIKPVFLKGTRRIRQKKDICANSVAEHN
jgi:hypothetical protein